jgi:hypothetical protein
VKHVCETRNAGSDRHLNLRKDESDGEKENIVERDSPRNLRNQAEVLEKKFIQVILTDLYERPFSGQ